LLIIWHRYNCKYILNKEMAKVIIAIHGLRNKPTKEILSKWAYMSIKEGQEKAYLKFEMPVFELAYWADILYDKPLSENEKDKKDPCFLDEVYVPAENDNTPKNHNFIRKTKTIFKKIIYSVFLNSQYKLRFAFISKSFIHNNFKDLEVYFTENCEKVQSEDCIKKEEINNRLIQLLEKYKNDEIFLIAHSMGSIIAFDVLSFIEKDILINTFVTIGSPLGAPFVISKLAKLSKSENQGNIKLQTPESVNKHWYNFSDITDNIAMDYKLSDDFEANSKGVKVEDQIVINTYKMNGKPNPHKSFGYLRTPEFIKVFSEFINKKEWIKETEARCPVTDNIKDGTKIIVGNI